MPIRIQNDLPARGLLEEENIFVMDEKRALSQEIRPLKVGILNLMPLKEDTELQLFYDRQNRNVNSYHENDKRRKRGTNGRKYVLEAIFALPLYSVWRNGMRYAYRY